MILSCKALSKRDKGFHVKHYPKEINLKIRIRCELTAIDVYDSLRYHSKGTWCCCHYLSRLAERPLEALKQVEAKNLSSTSLLHQKKFAVGSKNPLEITAL